MNIDDILDAAKIIPVLEVSSLEKATPLAKALARGGMQVVEVTLRTPCALEVVAAMRSAAPELIVGVVACSSAQAASAIVVLRVLSGRCQILRRGQHLQFVFDALVVPASVARAHAARGQPLGFESMLECRCAQRSSEACLEGSQRRFGPGVPTVASKSAAC